MVSGERVALMKELIKAAWAKSLEFVSERDGRLSHSKGIMVGAALVLFACMLWDTFHSHGFSTEKMLAFGSLFIIHRGTSQYLNSKSPETANAPAPEKPAQ
jgi:hypothetical protein